MTRSTPEKVVCMDANPCPSYHSSWETSGAISSEDLQVYLDKAGYETDVFGNCEVRTIEKLKAFSPCEAKGRAGDYTVRVKVLVDEQLMTTQVSLFLF